MCEETGLGRIKGTKNCLFKCLLIIYADCIVLCCYVTPALRSHLITLNQCLPIRRDVMSTSYDSGIPSSMYPGAPPFQAWKLDELPEMWKESLRDPNTRYIAVELPDEPWGHAYHAWFAANHTTKDFKVLAASMVLNMQDYNGGRNQERRSREVLQSLLQTGKPPPHFIRLLHQSEASDTMSQQEMIIVPRTSQSTSQNSTINSYLRNAMFDSQGSSNQ